MGYKWYGPLFWADLIRVGLGRKVPKRLSWLPFVRQSKDAEQRLRQAAKVLAGRENEHEQ